MVPLGSQPGRGPNMIQSIKRKGFGLLVRFELGRLERVAKASRKRGTSPGFPRDRDELAAMQDWAVEGLRRSGAIPNDAAITDYEVAPFAEDLAFRSSLGLVTVAWRGGSVRAVAKMAPTPTSLREHAIYLLQKNHVKEVGFYEEVAPRATISPTTYRTAVNVGSGQFCILMEYCDGLSRYDETQGAPPEAAYRFAEALAQFHALHWGGKGPKDPPRFLTPVPPVAIEWFASNLAAPPILRRVFAHCWHHDVSDHQTVIHSDARVGNVLFPSERHPERLVLYDWQACRSGRGVFDLVYFILLSMRTEDRHAHWDRLLDHYHAALMAAGVPRAYSRATLDDDAFNAALLTVWFVSAPLLSRETSTTSRNLDELGKLADAWTARLITFIVEADWSRAARWVGVDGDALAKAAVGLVRP